MLSIDDILQADDSKVEPVKCPEWSGDVYIRSLTADERDKLERVISEGISETVALVSLSLCNEDGKSLNITPVQMKSLGRKAAGPMRRIAEQAMELNGWTEAARETIEKNSEQTDASN
jgi:hypothetical protein